jgi:hypothetical protein
MLVVGINLFMILIRIHVVIMVQVVCPVGLKLKEIGVVKTSLSLDSTSLPPLQLQLFIFYQTTNNNSKFLSSIQTTFLYSLSIYYYIYSIHRSTSSSTSSKIQLEFMIHMFDSVHLFTSTNYESTTTTPNTNMFISTEGPFNPTVLLFDDCETHPPLPLLRPPSIFPSDRCKYQ